MNQSSSVKNLIASTIKLKLSMPEEALKDLKEMNFSNHIQTFNIIKIQSFWKMKILMKNYKNLKKKFRYRKKIIEELIKTEEIYVKSLNLIIENTLNESSKYLKENEIKSIFSNIESIYKFNSKFLNDLKKNFENYSNYSLFSDTIIKILPYFKLYFDYLNNFSDSRKFLENLISKKHLFYSELVQKIEYTEKLNNLDFSSMIVKPVQRLPKYVLLFKDFKKNTPEYHPDYNNIDLVLKKFIELNEDTNKNIDRYLRSLKLFELQKNFGTKDFTVVGGQREFLLEETVSYLKDEFPTPAICKIFNFI